MQITQSLSQRMEQKLVMTRQMIQSIEMLQLPLMDLQQNINQELSSSPWLEMMEGDPVMDAAQSSPALKATKEAEAAPDGEDPRLKRMEVLLKEWNDPLTRGERGMVRRMGEDDAKQEAMLNTAAPTITLEDHLTQQLHLSREEPRLKKLAEFIVGSLDDGGYLKVPLMDVFYKNDGFIRRAVVDDKVTEEEAELALSLVQSFDPPGVGARTVPECLLLQLRRLNEDVSFEEQLVEKHLEDLSHNRLPKIAKDMGVTMERVKEGLQRISHLNPKPGRLFGGARPQYVVPDVVVEEVEGELMIRINEHFLPSLRISADSLTLLKKEPKDSPVREYIMGKLGSAVWLMESVIQRRNTLFRIAQQIVDIQRPFFEHGPSHLKPLMMQEVAERIHMHVSTVSRALAGKYMQTPQGLFPMKYFFTGGFATADGESESNRAIMLKIQDMVKAESKDNPLSDQEIVERLKAENIDIARRTVAKYREKLNIPSSRQRKAY
ncbi:MAG: RNA polymerase factor sigma-54 [Planctomycetota bacterium]|nr:RNA polymerase factor sigma-54 [Planctomycetota bacterium]